MKSLICKFCEKSALLSFCDETNAEMINNNACFGCSFYLDLSKDKANSFINETGEVYTIGEQIDNSSKQKGFGGIVFLVHLNDGRSFETDNLWHRGKAPTNLRNFFAIKGAVKEKR